MSLGIATGKPRTIRRTITSGDSSTFDVKGTTGAVHVKNAASNEARLSWGKTADSSNYMSIAAGAETPVLPAEVKDGITIFASGGNVTVEVTFFEHG